LLLLLLLLQLLWYVDFFLEGTFDFNDDVAFYGFDSCLLEGIEQKSGAGLASVIVYYYYCQPTRC